MLNNSGRYCKFCGERVKFIDDFNDYYCDKCYSYQTISVPIKFESKNEFVKLDVDSSEPLDKPLDLPKNVRNNIPIFRHRTFLVYQKIMQIPPIFEFYNISGEQIGESKAKFQELVYHGGVGWSSEFNFYDNSKKIVAKTRLHYYKRTRVFDIKRILEIHNHENTIKGYLKAPVHLGFNKKWSLLDADKNLIGKPSKKKWKKNHFEFLNPKKEMICAYDRSIKELKDIAKITIAESFDPLLAIATLITIAYVSLIFK